MRRTIAVLILAALAAGCGRADPGTERIETEVAKLRQENEDLRARVADLESKLAETRETTVVARNEDGIELRLNAATALVLIAVVAGIVVGLIFFLRYRYLAEAARWGPAPPPE
jgi:hypothetical protein